MLLAPPRPRPPARTRSYRASTSPFVQYAARLPCLSRLSTPGICKQFTLGGFTNCPAHDMFPAAKRFSRDDGGIRWYGCGNMCHRLNSSRIVQIGYLRISNTKFCRSDCGYSKNGRLHPFLNSNSHFFAPLSFCHFGLQRADCLSTPFHPTSSIKAPPSHERVRRCSAGLRSRA